MFFMGNDSMVVVYHAVFFWSYIFHVNDTKCYITVERVVTSIQIVVTCIIICICMYIQYIEGP